jgi:hypothetical protein
MTAACIFKHNDSNFIVNYKDEDNELSLNFEGIFDLETAKKRLANDFMKDGYEPPKISELPQIIKETFNLQQKGNYKINLKDIEESGDIAPQGNERFYQHVLKTSTTGEMSDEYASHAKNVVYESGMGPKKLCLNHNLESFKIIGTPAALLDPASKVDPTHYFPNTSMPSVTFDNTFTSQFAFPYNLEWSSSVESSENQNTFNVNIKSEDPSAGYKFEERTNVTWHDANPIESDILRGLVVGNKEKNTEINKLWKQISKKKSTPHYKECLSRIYKLLLMKELGDVAQVWMYYALIIAALLKHRETTSSPPQSPTSKKATTSKKGSTSATSATSATRKKVSPGTRGKKATSSASTSASTSAKKFPDITIKEIQDFINDYLMITTDSVVYFLCKILNIPAVYTGSREGVKSGHCSLKYFNVGEPDYALNLKNLLMREVQRIKQHNTSTMNCIRHILQVKDSGTGLLSLDVFNFHIKIDFQEAPSSSRAPRKGKTPARLADAPPKIGVRKAAPIGNDVILNGNDIFLGQKPERKEVINTKLRTRFLELIDSINDLTQRLEERVTALETLLETIEVTTSLQMRENYTKINDELKQYKCKQFITILPFVARVRGVKFIFNYTEFLRVDEEMTFYRPEALQSTHLSGAAVKFVKGMIPTEFYTAAEINNAYGDYDSEEEEDIIEDKSEYSDKYSTSGGSTAISGKATSTSGKATSTSGGGKQYIGTTSSIGYYESLVMYYIYTFFFNAGHLECPSNIDDDVLLKNPHKSFLFAKYYDMFTWQCESADWKIDELEEANHFEKIFNTYTDHEIEMFGAKLSKHIHFFNSATDPDFFKLPMLTIDLNTQLAPLGKPVAAVETSGVVDIVDVDRLGRGDLMNKKNNKNKKNKKNKTIKTIKTIKTTRRKRTKPRKKTTRKIKK